MSPPGLTRSARGVKYGGSSEPAGTQVLYVRAGLELPSRLEISEALPTQSYPDNMMDSRPPQPFVLEGNTRTRHFCDRCRELPSTVWTDWENFYSCPGTRDLLLGLGVGAVLANTSLDQRFRDWYQAQVRTDNTDRFASFWEGFGDGTIIIPSVVGLAVVGTLCDDTAASDLAAQFGLRSTRAYLVGTPPTIFGQWALGGCRPGESPVGSRWSPFQDNNAISGHAFVGGVPLITAAKMSDTAWLKAGFYGLSVLPAWSRVNDDKHYLSQAALGWWMAYLACSAVETTNMAPKPFSVVPLLARDTVGVNVVYSR